MSSTISPDVPSSPAALYRDRREAGANHQDAARTVEHAFGRRDLGPQLARARSEYETPRPPTDAPAQEITEPDPLDAAEAEIRERIGGLTEDRQHLAFDSLDDPKARSALTRVEADLAEAESELDHIGLARTETARREQTEREQVEQDRVQAASDRAAELGVEREQVEARLHKDARSLAVSIAALHSIASQQATALTEAGHPNASQVTSVSPGALQRILGQALREASAPTGWLS